jgi:hypothetical protein
VGARWLLQTRGIAQGALPSVLLCRCARGCLPSCLCVCVCPVFVGCRRVCACAWGWLRCGRRFRHTVHLTLPHISHCHMCVTQPVPCRAGAPGAAATAARAQHSSTAGGWQHWRQQCQCRAAGTPWRVGGCCRLCIGRECTGWWCNAAARRCCCSSGGSSRRCSSRCGSRRGGRSS